MGKYSIYSRRTQVKPRPWKIHPIWRGIGCLMMVIIPVMSYAGAVLLVRANIEQGWVPMPGQLLWTITIPYLGFSVEHMFGNLLVMVVLTFIGFAGLMILYALLYRIIGPPPLTPLDAPAEHRRVKRSR